MPLKGTRFSLAFRSTLIPTGDYDGGAVVDRQYDLLVPNGTAANQADKLWSDARSLAGTTAEDLDLQTLTDANNTALALAEVVAVIIEVGAENNGNLEIEPGASNGWDALFNASQSIELRPGSVAAFYCPTNPAWAVDATNKVLNINNLGAGTGSYRITVLGRST